MANNKYSSELKQQTLSAARQRGSRTLESVATEMGVSLGTLKSWLKELSRAEAGAATQPALPSDVPARQWSPVQRMLALQESHALSGEALHAWCREKGLFEHQLKQWHDDFCAVASPVSVPAIEHRQTHAALRELQRQHEQLQRELRRKDKALAEAAALLILQKKFRALWEGEDT